MAEAFLIVPFVIVRSVKKPLFLAHPGLVPNASRFGGRIVGPSLDSSRCFSQPLLPGKGVSDDSGEIIVLGCPTQ